jgi:hypothetical protein
MEEVMRNFLTMFSIIILAISFSNAQNLLQNPGFEDGTGVLPDNWSTYIQNGTSDFSWVTDTIYNGAKAVCIIHADSAMSSFYQKVVVQANYKYKVSGYIKTENIGSRGAWWEGGAQLRIDGDVTGNYWDNMTSKLEGTNDWTYVELEVTTKSDADTIGVNCKLGEGYKIAGTAWYDDIVLEEVGPVTQFFTNGGFEEEDPENAGYPRYWKVENERDGKASMNDTVHTGDYSLKIHTDLKSGSENPEIILQQDAGPAPDGWIDGGWFKVSGWIKTENIVGSRGACIICAWNNHSIGNVQLHGDTNWTYIEEIVTYEETAWGGIRCFTGTDGTEEGNAWFDDVNIEFIAVPPGDPTNLQASYDGSKITLNWNASEQGTNAISYYLIRRILEDDTTGNIKKNPGFEEQNAAGDFANYWSKWGDGVFNWDFSYPLNGDYCVSVEDAWGMVYKTVYPPDDASTGCDALMRGFIKTENVSGGSGAYLGFGYYASDVPDGIFGTNEYTKVTNYSSLDGGKYACCLLGRYGETISGKSWFDDVTVTPLDSLATSPNATFEDTDIVEDTTYYYSVRAVDTEGFFSNSALIKVNLTPPDVVTLISPVDNSRVLEAKLTWEEIIGVDGYYVKVKKSGVQVWEQDDITNNYVTAPAETFEEDSAYTWTVQYKKDSQYSDLSEEWSFIYTEWPATFDYISDLAESYWQNPWGDGNKNLSHDGNPILIAGVEYSKGLGMHANAEVHYPLCDWDYNQFMTYIGHDDEANGGDGVIFKVALDYDTVFTSNAKKWGDPAELIKLSVAGVDTLRLLIDMIDNDGYDHADWADAILYKAVTGIDRPDDLIPTTTQLIGNYPNPFNPSTTIAYQLHKPAKVKVEIFNIIGQKVKTLVNAPQSIGNYKVNWNTVNDVGGKVASGIYLYRLEANNVTQVKKMILIR